MNKSPRLIAFEILHKVFTNNSYSNLVLDSSLSKIDNDRDKSFVSALVYGVIERKITLDYYINKYLTSKPKPKIMNVLRLGAYQILFMDSVPNSAAINESVKLTKEIKQDYYSKLVNAVLHKIENDHDEINDISVKYSIPENLANMWNKQYGVEIVNNFLPNTIGRPPIFAVPNRIFVDENELQYELLCEDVNCEVINNLVMINSSVDLKKLRAFKNGLFYIEDMSSYECAIALGAKEGETVIDMCSAPGGKAFTIAQSMNNKGKIYAFDLYESRVNLINSGAKRLEINIIEASVGDATIYNENIPIADRILCDVPCSGFGIIRRKPEIKYKELDDIKNLPDIQLKILKNASNYLKNGGVMIYSTCTLNKKENEKVVERFLSEENFVLEFDKTLFPSSDSGDGFYYAKLVKNEN